MATTASNAAASPSANRCAKLFSSGSMARGAKLSELLVGITDIVRLGSPRRLTDASRPVGSSLGRFDKSGPLKRTLRGQYLCGDGMKRNRSLPPMRQIPLHLHLGEPQSQPLGSCVNIGKL